MMGMDSDEFYGYACPGLALSVANIDSAVVIPLDTLNAFAFQASPSNAFPALRDNTPSGEDRLVPSGASPGQWSTSDASTEGLLTTPRHHSQSFQDDIYNVGEIPSSLAHQSATGAQPPLLQTAYVQYRPAPSSQGIPSHSEAADLSQFATEFSVDKPFYGPSYVASPPSYAKHGQLPTQLQLQHQPLPLQQHHVNTYPQPRGGYVPSQPHTAHLTSSHVHLSSQKRTREDDVGTADVPGRDKRRKLSLSSSSELAYALGPPPRSAPLPSSSHPRQVSDPRYPPPPLVSSLDRRRQNPPPVAPPPPPIPVPPVDDEEDAEGEDDEEAAPGVAPVPAPNGANKTFETTSASRSKKEPVLEQDEYESSDEESYYEEDDTADEDYKP